LALSLLPCTDYAASSHDHTEQNATALTSQTTHQDKETQHVDLCSPFCTCNCCGRTIATVTTFETFLLPTPLATQEAHEVFYTAPYYWDALDAIWQPPKYKA